ncbi:GNAT family N-acetyltransferase [Alicyclobacillus tolerans]|uniref:Ribosomal protein S18 acetylase RimI-like enzyme n=2 Tax=Alicyclobacillus tolerans TaxID=90970 RepID=A0ABT9LTM3_9BACL|nr:MULTISPECIES: GNAT family N-acetyltransferase [Alicyclobacillus]MDP9727610.1 ribosomal protein S18 acetylase RimI-like enzyme [Alicyclobacillus tengchongensis]SHJ64545.1 Ribosomal protein S18 acetylase RimI [Alicyclobacillus montanus]
MQQKRRTSTGLQSVRKKKRPQGRKTAQTTGQTPSVSLPTALTYRLRRPEDDEYIVKLTSEQLGGIHQNAFGEPFPESTFLHYLQSGAPTVIIEKDGKRIGYYSYLVGPAEKMHISAMVLEPRYQSSGIGREVMARIEKRAKEQGIQVLEVFVQENNEKSLNFTRQLGFQEVFRLEPHSIAFQKRIL